MFSSRPGDREDGCLAWEAGRPELSSTCDFSLTRDQRLAAINEKNILSFLRCRTAACCLGCPEAEDKQRESEEE